jgi:hypothetical protein
MKPLIDTKFCNVFTSYHIHSLEQQNKEKALVLIFIPNIFHCKRIELRNEAKIYTSTSLS